MAHFRGTVQGNRSEASRLGHKNSGLDVTCNGWEQGIRVCARHLENGKDAFTVYANGGSGYGNKEFEIGTLFSDGEFVPSAEVCAAVDKLRGVQVA